MRILHFFIALFVFFKAEFSFSQKKEKDTIQRLEEVVIIQAIDFEKYDYHSGLSEKEIEELTPVDVGELLQKIPGTTLKSYGSLGGLKTVSMRSMGATHTTIVGDGFSIQNMQTGQVNLGQIDVENIVGVVSSVGRRSQLMLPVSAQVSGSNFLLKTFENTFSSDTLQIRTTLKVGSFGQKMGYLAGKYCPKNWMISLSGTRKISQGNYPYLFLNGNQYLKGIRINNDYEDYAIRSTVGFRWKNKVSMRLGYKQSKINQALPGAVILYNNTQDERMKTEDRKLFMDVFIHKNRWATRLYTNGNFNVLNYTDPTFLNNSGGIDVTYTNRFWTAGVTLSWRNDQWELHGGFEEVWSSVRAVGSVIGEPERLHTYGLIGGKYMFLSGSNFFLDLSTQYVNEENKTGLEGQDRWRINPFLGYRSSVSGQWRWKHEIWYRNSFRMPTFNELYYNNIGNTLLLPEDAHQFNYSLRFMPIRKKNWHINFKNNIYHNRVKNKIVAVPTKNLFIWSMQNVGKVAVYGYETILSAHLRMSHQWKIEMSVNYSYQRTVDITKKGSPTYKHQVAYVPVHTMNMDASLYYQRFGLRLSNYGISDRYSLNENVLQNRVEGFLISDVIFFYTLPIKKHVLRLQAAVKNILDVPYAYIRSFVMPGRNYLISLSYAFN